MESRAVITGDVTQIDLPAGHPSGLVEAHRLLKKIYGIGFVEFDQRDVVRHPLVRDIITAYADDYEARRLAKEASEALKVGSGADEADASSDLNGRGEHVAPKPADTITTLESDDDG
jgi:hypothetical protein